MKHGIYSGEYLNYYDIPVEKDMEIHIDIQGNSLNSSSDVSVNCEGETYSPETASISSRVGVSVNADSKKGTITGAGSYMIGDLVSVVATPSENYFFDGWYEGDSLKTFNEEYLFEARKDTVLTALFTPKNPDEGAESSVTPKPANSNNAASNNSKTMLPKSTAVVKKTNPMVVKTKAIKLKATKLLKKKQTIKKSKVFKISDAAGKVTFKKKSGNKKITVSKSGKITVKKGLKKGTYKLKVNVTAAGNSNYLAGTKAVTVKVKVK